MIRFTNIFNEDLLSKKDNLTSYKNRYAIFHTTESKKISSLPPRSKVTGRYRKESTGN